MAHFFTSEYKHIYLSMDVREQDTIKDIKSARAFFWGSKYVLYLSASISSGEENWDGSE